MADGAFIDQGLLCSGYLVTNEIFTHVRTSIVKFPQTDPTQDKSAEESHQKWKQ